MDAVQGAGGDPSSRLPGQHPRRGILLMLRGVAKGVVSFGRQVGWQSMSVGQSWSGSIYVHLRRKRDGKRLCIRLSDHRHPKGRPDDVDVEWLHPDHCQIGVKWLREWLIREWES